ncbi:MAG: hypothetical protein HZA67_04740 [Rhodospirillales bacterium]|nr:hypothetical protein [Rhodospirillales bacterium]
MKYEDMDRETFDAVVTGELTHYCLWIEAEIEETICDFFEVPESRNDVFSRYIMKRDGLSFQDKIEILRGLVSEQFPDSLFRVESLKTLQKAEEYKGTRNTMAHGQDFGGDGLEIIIGVINRAGKEKRHGITPKSHRVMMKEGEDILQQIVQMHAVILLTNKAKATSQSQ